MVCGTFRLRPSLSLRSTEAAKNVAPMLLPPLHLKVAVATGVSASAGTAISAPMARTANFAKLEQLVMAASPLRDPRSRLARRARCEDLQGWSFFEFRGVPR